jgi:hypothetical protein
MGAAVGDPLPSWNDTATRQAITQFVEAASSAGGPGSTTRRHGTGRQ